jgi:hypothetical protein
MDKRIPVTALAVLLLPVTACSGGSTTTDEVSYRIDQVVTALTIDARAAAIRIVAGDGPVTVTEKVRYSAGKPNTSHRVDGQMLRLSETGCGDDDARCQVEYQIRAPGAVSADITTQAGAVTVDGLAGDVHITTEAGAVEARALTGDEVIVKTEAGAASLEFAEAPALIRTTTGLGAVAVRVPGATAYAVDVRTSVGTSAVGVDRDPASAHRIEVHTEVGAVSIERLP